MEKKRCFGVLLPISPLPSGEGIGTLGASAYRFVDLLASAGGTIWQVLPLVPTGYGDSPYQSCSSLALNYYFIDLETLQKEGLLKEEEIATADLLTTPRRVDYGKQFYHKIALLRLAFSRFDKENGAFCDFVKAGKYEDFAVFMALKCKFDHRPWQEWEEPYRDFDPDVVARFARENEEELLFWQFTQFEFLREWRALKGYANEKGVQIMGDIPLYLAYDSVEMWKYGDALFRVDEKRRPSFVAGVPPDAFCDDGQLWGNPLYDWEKMKKDDYRWWNARLKNSLDFFDILRIDHFRGFDRYYAVPAQDTTARNGAWVKGPAEALFRDKLDWNIVAEDLGVIDAGVVRMMRALGYPGMKILEFAFDGNDKNEHKPSNYKENYVCYTGTHDNMPLAQYIDDLSEREFLTYQQDMLLECTRAGVMPRIDSTEAIVKSVIELAFASAAYAVVIPLWDLLAMGGEARINLPATVTPENWSFRFFEEELAAGLDESLRALAQKTRRANVGEDLK